MIPTSGFLTALECTKFVFGRGSAPNPAGELIALPRHVLAVLRWALLLRRRIREGKGRPPNANSWIHPCYLWMYRVNQDSDCTIVDVTTLLVYTLKKRVRLAMQWTLMKIRYVLSTILVLHLGISGKCIQQHIIGNVFIQRWSTLSYSRGVRRNWWRGFHFPSIPFPSVPSSPLPFPLSLSLSPPLLNLSLSFSSLSCP